MAKNVGVDLTRDGRWPAVALPTGDTHVITLRLPMLQLERHYHDDEAIQQAPFTVELADGSQVEGTLDASGKAVVKSLRSTPKRVRFGADARPYERVDTRQNPDYKQDRTADELDALVQRRMTES